MALKFLHIGKASARIDELEAQVATLTKERDEALKAVESNSGEVTRHAEALQTDLGTATKSNADLLQANSKLLEQASAKDAEIKTLKDQIAASASQVEVKVARQVAQTQAALGQPPIPAIPAEAKSAAASKNGISRVM